MDSAQQLTEALAVREEMGAEGNEFVLAARKVSISSNEDYENAAEFLKSVAALEKKIKETFKPIKQSMDAAKKSVLAMEKEALGPPMEAKTELGIKMRAYTAEIEKKREAEAKRAEAAAKRDAKKMGVPQSTVPIQAPKTEIPKAKGVTHKTIWKFEITDPSKINPEYMTPDMTKIGKLVRAVGADAANSIGKGVRVYSEQTTATRVS